MSGSTINRRRIHALLVQLFTWGGFEHFVRSHFPGLVFRLSFSVELAQMCEMFCRAYEEHFADDPKSLARALVRHAPDNTRVVEFAKSVNATPESAREDEGTGKRYYSQRHGTATRFLNEHLLDHSRIRAIERSHLLPNYIQDADIYTSSQWTLAAEYFGLVAKGLECAQEADSGIRLDIYLYIMDGALSELSCEFLMTQLRIAAVTPGFQREHSVSLSGVLAGLNRCIVEHLESGALPSFINTTLVQSLRAAWASPSASEPVALRMRQQRLLQLMHVTRLIDGTGMSEDRLLDIAKRAIARANSDELTPRVVALLHYRRCLAYVYLGRWRALQTALAGPVTYLQGWSPNWTAFLCFQLGDIEHSRALYEKAITDDSEAVRAVATQSLLELLPATHSPLVVENRDYFAALEANYARDAELETGLARFPQQIRGRRGLDQEYHLHFLLKCSRQYHQTSERIALEESGRGVILGDANPGRPVHYEFQRRWLHGIPTVGLRDTQVQALIKSALRVMPLASVLELNRVVGVLHAWDPQALREAATIFVRRSSMAEWRAQLHDQVGRLQRSIQFFLAERRVGFRSAYSSRDRQFDAIFMRIRSEISFFVGLIVYLPDEVVHPVGRMCASLIRHWSIYWVLSKEERQGWCALTWMAISQTRQTPERIGIDPDQIAKILASERDGSPEMIACWLREHCQTLGSRYLRRLQRAFAQAQERQGIKTPVALAQWLKDGDLMPLSRRQLIINMLEHWSNHRQHGISIPPLVDISPPTGFNEIRFYEDRLRPAIEGLIARRFYWQDVIPLAWRWFERGIYGLSELALKFDDVELWLRLFEESPLWSHPWEGIGLSVERVRSACEDPELGASRRLRIFQRVAMSRIDREWPALVWLLEYLLRAASMIYPDDVMVLRVLSRRAPHPATPLQVLRPFTTLLQRFGARHAGASGEDRAIELSIASMLVGMPQRIAEQGLISRVSAGLVDRMLARIAALPAEVRQRLGEPRWRAGLETLRGWLDAHDYRELQREIGGDVEDP